MTKVLTFILIVILLAGCSQRTSVGLTCVSCKPYVCRGSYYIPQKYYEYDEVGLASWYGEDFHGKPKATGEKFDKYLMTAAHRTLPIPSVVKVTNLKNGKSVIVVVDDRGPYTYRGRIIDLPYAAAKAIGVGVTKVRVQTLVSDSLQLSNYIALACKKRKDPFGRSWAQLYFDVIKRGKVQCYKGSQELNKKQKNSKKKYNPLGKYIKT